MIEDMDYAAPLDERDLAAPLDDHDVNHCKTKPRISGIFICCGL